MKITKSEGIRFHALRRAQVCKCGHLEMVHINQCMVRGCKCEKYERKAIDDQIDDWHKQPNGLELHEYLGMTEEEYAEWLRNPK